MEEGRFSEKLKHDDETLDNINFKIRFLRLPVASYIVSVILLITGLILVFAGRDTETGRFLLGIIIGAAGIMGLIGSYFWYFVQKRKYDEYKKKKG